LEAYISKALISISLNTGRTFTEIEGFLFFMNIYGLFYWKSIITSIYFGKVKKELVFYGL